MKFAQVQVLLLFIVLPRISINNRHRYTYHELISGTIKYGNMIKNLTVLTNGLGAKCAHSPHASVFVSHCCINNIGHSSFSAYRMTLYTLLFRVRPFTNCAGKSRTRTRVTYVMCYRHHSRVRKLFRKDCRVFSILGTFRILQERCFNSLDGYNQTMRKKKRACN